MLRFLLDTDTAIAILRGLTVITGNTREFGRVPGLRCEDWLRDP